MKYSNPVYMFTEKTVAELREEAEREAEREIKSEEDYERAVRAEKMRIELWEMEQEAIDYGYGINTGAATPAALITFIDYRKALAEQRNGDGPAPGPQAGKQPRGLTEKTKARAAIFKQLKDANPRLSQQGLATRANNEYGDVLDKYITVDDVRNAYQAMGWEWERADKIR